MRHKQKQSSVPLQHWICCYDISDRRRLAKVHQLLSKEGIAVNYSVFYLYADVIKIDQLSKQLKRFVGENDDIRMYVGAHLQQAYYVGKIPHIGNHLIGEKGVLL